MSFAAAGNRPFGAGSLRILCIFRCPLHISKIVNETVLPRPYIARTGLLNVFYNYSIVRLEKQRQKGFLS